MTPNSSHVWLVTGAASGIGAAVVRTVADAGCSVFALDIDDEAGNALEGAHYRHLDVASERDWQTLADYLKSSDNALGIPDRIHLNAGIQIAPPDAAMTEYRFESMTPEKYRKLMGVNVDGVVFGLHTLLPLLNPGSSIVVTASLAGITPYPIDPLYSMSKHAVVGLVRSLGPSLRKRGINIHAICPGAIDTPLVPVAQRSEDVPFMAPEHVASEVIHLIEQDETGKTWAKVSDGKPLFIVRAPGDKQK
ncbi:MAG: SDR family oxidoreductase [Pseudomonadales bacterium]|nr:SDR family oxidoreductase [Pseudomonadales bacterium]MBO6702254.1 SDR family oxidoreductase [Pseudomonadales bacterium]MBO7007411.1 SDR family oxidoreductase [Pseudomonadales bacterium]